MADPCPVCGVLLVGVRQSDNLHFVCPQCGEFQITEEAFYLLRGEISRSELSDYQRRIMRYNKPTKTPQKPETGLTGPLQARLRATCGLFYMPVHEHVVFSREAAANDGNRRSGPLPCAHCRPVHHEAFGNVLAA